MFIGAKFCNIRLTKEFYIYHVAYETSNQATGNNQTSELLSNHIPLLKGGSFLALIAHSRDSLLRSDRRVQPAVLFRRLLTSSFVTFPPLAAHVTVCPHSVRWQLAPVLISTISGAVIFA